MKLKKIASLMLAGVMAVSMLAGCSGKGTDNGNDNGGNGGETTPSASYTSTVLAETNKSTQAVLSASTNTKLDKAVAAEAANYTIDNASGVRILTVVPAKWNQVTLATKVMEGAENYTATPESWNFAPSATNKDSLAGTWWTMGYVSRAMTDEYITEQVADMLDSWAEQMAADGKVVEGATWDYTVSVAKADSLAGNSADRSKDAVVVGLAITVTKTDVKY